jgi:hypothetical protein
MERDIVDIVQDEIISRIDNTVRVTSIIESTPSDLRFTVCDYKWLKTKGGHLRSAGDVFYYPDDIDPETGIIHAKNPGTALELRQVLTIKPPVFVHGTHRVTNVEWLRSINKDVRLGVPLIWLKETIPGMRYPEDHSQLKDETPTFYFLDEIDVVDSTNAEQRVQGVKPMLALVAAFYKAIEDGYEITRRSGSFEKTISRFGNEMKDGMIENILDANLGGVEIRPTLTITKTVGCC